MAVLRAKLSLLDPANVDVVDARLQVSYRTIYICEFDLDKVLIFYSRLLVQRLFLYHSKNGEKHIETFFSMTLRSLIIFESRVFIFQPW